jgi:hypothetical protein
MVSRGIGSVINIAPMLAMSGTLPPNPLPYRAVYAEAKAFLATFTQALVRQEFNVSDPLLQLVKRSEPTLEECLAIDSGFDALGTAIEKTHTKRMFEIGDYL